MHACPSVYAVEPSLSSVEGESWSKSTMDYVTASSNIITNSSTLIYFHNHYPSTATALSNFLLAGINKRGSFNRNLSHWEDCIGSSILLPHHLPRPGGKGEQLPDPFLLARRLKTVCPCLTRHNPRGKSSPPKTTILQAGTGFEFLVHVKEGWNTGGVREGEIWRK